jgi:hypothetical protein
MSNELLSSKVVLIEEEPAQRGLAALPTSIAGAVGVAARGPIGQATLVTTWDEYVRRFGGFVAGADLPLAVLGFFQNGGRQLWVVRTCHYASPDDPSTASAAIATASLLSAASTTPAELVGAPLPVPLTSGDTLAIAIDGQPAVPIPFVGTAAQLRTATAGPFALAADQTLVLAVDGGAAQTVTFTAAGFADLAKATAAELAAVLAAALPGVTTALDAGRLLLASATRGTASRLQVLGGTAAPVLDLPLAPATGTGTVARLAAVTLAELTAAVLAADLDLLVDTTPTGALRLRSRSTGAGAQLRAQPTTAPAFGLDLAIHVGRAVPAARAVDLFARSAGAWANRLTVEVRRGSQPALADLIVREAGTPRETFLDASLDPRHARYLPRLVNDAARGSTLLRGVDLRIGALALAPGIALLDGGDDGTAPITDDDFLGSTLGRTGLHALNNVPDLSLAFIPGRATPRVHAALLHYAEVTRQGSVFALLDPPAALSATGILAYQASAGLEGASEYGALYWPHVLVANPDLRALGPDATVVVPPSGAIAGMIARTDGARPGGVYDPPAGVDIGRLLGIAGLESLDVLDENLRDLLYPHRINPLNRSATGAWYVDGVYTLRGDGNFPTIAERRGVSAIERALRGGLEFARHRNHDDALASEVFRTIKGYLMAQLGLGAFASRDPKTAFWVEVSRDPAERLRGELTTRIGLATQKPAEFVIVRLSQMTLASSAPSPATTPTSANV